MSVDDTSTSGPTPGPWNNGLLAASYVPLTDVSAPMAPRLLSALERARIAAYLAETADADGTLRLYVASGERADARTIVASVVRATNADADPSAATSADPSAATSADPRADPSVDPSADPSADPGVDPRAGAGAGAGSVPNTESSGGATPAGPARDPVAPNTDPLAGIDADAAFAALIADWHVDTHTAIRAAERDLSREDEDWRQRLRATQAAEAADPEVEELTWLDEDHYVPPNPPPIPRPTAAFLGGLLLILASLVLLAFGDLLALSFELRLFLAVSGILTATGIFVMRLRSYRDDDDDGAVL